MIYDFVALVGMFLCIYVMQATEHDRINREDVMWLQWLRRGAFTMTALALLYTICADWSPTAPIIVLLACADFILLVNAIALTIRNSSGDRQARRVLAQAKRRAI